MPPLSTPRARPSPLWAVFAFTFLNSIGTGVVTNGIVFMSKHGYGFSDTQNYRLAALLGIVYIAGALGAQPLIHALRRLHPTITTRSILMAMMVLMAALCTLPFVARHALSSSSPWPVWTLVTLYTPLTGILWPLVESYVSGGRSGPALRLVIGRFNIVWSSAIVLAYVSISRFVESQPAATILSLGAVHILCFFLLRFFTPEPAPHGHDAPEPHPPVYAKLLVAFRLLLPLSYVVSSALGPYLPGALTALSVPTRLQAIVATSWNVSRVFTFFALSQWHGWHGRWYPAIVGGVLLLAGFTGTVLAKEAASLPLLIAGLLIFGVGMAIIYSGALYYALEVGQAEVEAGGKHEALIGVGYTVGPGLFLAAGWLVSRGTIAPEHDEAAVIAMVGVLAMVVAGLVLRRVMRHFHTH